MNYFRLFGACLMLLCCTLSGFYFSYRLRQKLLLLNDLCEFLSRLQTNIRYFSDDIFKLINLSSPSALAQYFGEDKSDFSVWWRGAVNRISKSRGLSGDERKNLLMFGALLGATDTEGQLSHIGIYKGIFETARDEFRRDSLIKSGLYKRLGFFAGAVIFLMTI